MAERVTRRFGLGPTLIGALLIDASGGWILPLAHGSAAFLIGLILAIQFLGDIPWAVYFINEVSLRQAIIPHHLLGRANASLDFVAHGTAPLGALVAGVVAGLIGLRLTWLVGAIGIGLASLWLFFSPIRQLRTLARVSVRAPLSE